MFSALVVLAPPAEAHRFSARLHARGRGGWFVRRAPHVGVRGPQVFVRGPRVFVRGPRVGIGWAGPPLAGAVVIAPAAGYAAGAPLPPYDASVGPYPPPGYAPPPPGYAPRRRLWRPQLGLGVSGEALLSLGRGGLNYRGFGVLGQLRYRAVPHFGIELTGGYQRSTDAYGVVRRDVPFTFGFLIPFLAPHHVISPYLVLAGGLNFADLQFSTTPQLADRRLQAIGQLGAGLEIRLGRHFALNVDARFERRWNLTTPDPAVATPRTVGSTTVYPLADQYALRLGGGATIYF